MHARVSTLTLDPAKLDEVIGQLEREDLDKLKATDGFRGMTLLVDRSSGKGIGTTYWDSEDAMKAAEQIGDETRRRAAEAGGGGEPEVERFEVAIDTFVG
jgi:heme-degrading monooxygenase HmoA